MRNVLSVLLVLAAVACGDAGGGDPGSGESNVTALSDAPAGAADPLAACNGNAECTKARVLGILFSSNLRLTIDRDAARAPRSVGESIVSFLGDSHATFAVKTQAADQGTTKVNVAISTIFVIQGAELETPPEGCLSCQIHDEGSFLSFDFTIKDGKIVEDVVTAMFAG